MEEITWRRYWEWMSSGAAALEPVLRTGKLSRYRLLDVACRDDHRLLQVIRTATGPVLLGRMASAVEIEADPEAEVEAHRVGVHDEDRLMALLDQVPDLDFRSYDYGPWPFVQAECSLMSDTGSVSGQTRCR